MVSKRTQFTWKRTHFLWMQFCSLFHHRWEPACCPRFISTAKFIYLFRESINNFSSFMINVLFSGMLLQYRAVLAIPWWTAVHAWVPTISSTIIWLDVLSCLTHVLRSRSVFGRLLRLWAPSPSVKIVQYLEFVSQIVIHLKRSPKNW